MSNLRVPGPTPLPPEVLQTLSRQMINHRAPEYEEIQKRVVENLQYFFQTKNDIFLLTSSGMGGLEASVVNFFSPGDKIVSFTCGEFGNRWADVARAFGANVVQVKVETGMGISEELVRNTLSSEGGVKGVFITLNETATGVLNPVSKLASIIKARKDNPLILIDAISALGAVDLPMDKSGIDVLVTASQKAWMAPPGLAMIAVSKKTWQYHQKAKMPRYYFDLTNARKFAEKNQTPATPALTTLYGLDTALGMMRKEGRERIFKRHLDLMLRLRSGIKKMGLELFVKDEFASPTVTSVKVPSGVDAHDWLGKIKSEFQVVLAGGMGETKGKIIRIAHMGYVSRNDLDEVLNAVEKSLKEMN